MNTTNPGSFDLTVHGLTVTEVHHNLLPRALYEHANSDAPTVAYATVYPLPTLLRILSAQALAISIFR
jgi:uncharacterized transporter YbjL